MTKQIKGTSMHPRNLIEAPNKEAETRAKKREDKKAKRQARREKRATRRIFPIWLRIIVFVILAFAALILGMMAGYSLLGDGEPLEVLRFEFWQHILDIISGVE